MRAIHGRAPRWWKEGLLLTALLLLLPVRAEAMRGLDMRWRSYATAHFDIHYYEGEEDLAQRVGRVAEHAYETLVPVFRFTPSDRCQVVLTDHLDSANGLTSTIPYDRILLYAFPPEADGTLGSYDDYLHVLFFHEYTHLLHLNTIGGLPGVVNKVLGKHVLPNTALPKWYIEGIAVTVESRSSGRGRVGSSRTRMVLRSAVMDDTWLTLPEMTGSPLKRPRGSAAYLYGGEFISWVAERFGLEKLIAFQHDYGRQVIPFGINILARRHFGEDWVTLYDEWSRIFRARAEATVARVEAEGLVAGRPLTASAEEHDFPRYSPDGTRLAYIESTGHERQRIRVRDRETGAVETLRECDGFCHTLSWAPDGEALYYERYDVQGIVYYHRELFRAELPDGDSEQLSEGRRVREPDVDRQSGQVAWVTTQVGTTALEIFDPSDGSLRTLVPARGYDQLAHPRWSPDGREIVYSAWTEGDGRRDLYVVDVASGAQRRLTWDREMDLHPCWSPDGRFVLYSTEHEGIYNIHALRLADGALFRVTNVKTGAFQPDVDPQGRELAFTHYGGWGYDVHVLAYEPETWTPVETLTAQPPSRPSYEPPETAIEERGAYSPLPTLRPFRLDPTWTASAGGFSNVGLQLSGFDAVEQHYWLTAVDYAVETGRWSEMLVYTNRMLPIDLGVTASHYVRERTAFFESRTVRYDERVLGGSFDLSVPFPHVRRSFSLGAGYTLRWTDPVDRPQEHPSPDDLVPYRPAEGLLAGAYLSFGYSDTTSVLYGFTPEQGRSIAARVHWRHPALGSDFTTTSVTGYWKEYLRAPWAQHHVFVLRLQGGATFGDDSMRGGFSIGGIPEQDLFSAILNEQHLGGHHLRGYPSGLMYGDRMYLLNAEYRFPLLDIFRGIETFPVWASRLTGAVFADTGAAFSDGIENGKPRVGVGAEIRLQTTLLYSFVASFRLGYACGVMSEGEHQVYFILGAWP